jgi:hypothetical protein
MSAILPVYLPRRQEGDPNRIDKSAACSDAGRQVRQMKPVENNGVLSIHISLIIISDILLFVTNQNIHQTFNDSRT